MRRDSTSGVGLFDERTTITVCDFVVVLKVINKEMDRGKISCFTVNDEKVFSSYLQFCGIGLRNAQLYEKSQLEVKRNQVRKPSLNN